MAGGQIFVDESKQRDYLLVAGVVLPGDLATTRAVMRGLALGGQRRVHMAKESDPRRRSIAAAICETGVQATIYNAGRSNRSELDARRACLHALGHRRGRHQRRDARARAG